MIEPSSPEESVVRGRDPRERDQRRARSRRARRRPTHPRKFGASLAPMATPKKGGIPPMSPGAGNAVYPVTLNSDTMPRDVLIAVRQRRRHDLPSRVSVCCCPIQ